MTVIPSLERTLLVLAAAHLISVTPVMGQECTALSDSARNVLERDARDRQTIIDRVADRARAETGEDPRGLVMISTDPEQRNTNVRYVGLELPDSAFLQMRAMLGGYLEARPVEERNLVLEFGAPAVPLDRKATERCPPRLQNASLMRSLASLMLRERSTLEELDEAIRGDVGLLIDTEGSVRHVELEDSTGDEELDAQLVTLAQRMRFAPARVDDTPVPTWMSEPVEISRSESAEMSRSAAAEISIIPGTPGRTREPRLRNPNQVSGLLQREYPERARQEGVGARVVLWLLVDASGRVRDLDVRYSEAISAGWGFVPAARRVAWRMRFEPALHDGEPVPVWIAQPITFAVR